MITINIDLGSAQEVKALVIYDHNMTSAATITLKGVDPAIFSESVTWVSGKIIHYLSAATTKRYWQLQITDAANTDLYIDIGELFLGSYMELSRNYTEGFSKGFDLLYDSNRTPYGIIKKRFYNRQRTFNFDFNCIVAADLTLLETMIDTIASRSTGRLDSFWFNDNAANPDDTWMVDISAVPEDHKTRALYTTALQLSEVMRSV